MPHNYLFFWYFLLSLNGWKNFHRKRTSSLLKFRCQSQIRTKKKFSMTILNDTVLESNKYLKLNFGGGDLSSDAGLLLIKEFACKLGFVNILKKESKPMTVHLFVSIKMMKICDRCGLLRWISVSGGNVVNLSPKALIFQGYRALFFCENFCFFLKRLDKSLQKWGRCSDKLNHT